MQQTFSWIIRKGYKSAATLGLGEEQLREVFKIIGGQKRFWAISILISIVLPFLDMAITASLYLIVAKDKRVAFQQSLLDHMPTWSLSEMIYVVDFVYIIFFAAIIIVLLSLTARYLQRTLVGKLRAHYATRNAQVLISQYLICDARIARELSRERVVSSILNDCGGGEQFTRKLVELASAGIGLVIYGIGAVILSPSIVAVVGIVYILPFILTRKVYGRVKKLADRQILTREGVIKNVRDLSDSSSRVRVDGTEELIEADVLGVVTKQKWQSYRLVRVKAQFSSIFDGFGQIQLLAIVLLSTTLLEVPIESLLILLIVFAKLSNYLGQITGGIQALRVAEAKFNRYTDLIHRLGVRDLMIPKEIRKSEKIFQVSCTNVGFAYEADKPILDDISLELKQGDRVLLTGGSGNGKTTLIDVLSGLIIPDAGHVMLNQRPLNREQFYRLRSQMILASSTMYVFDHSIRFNLALDIERDEEQLWEALRMVELHNFVADCSLGLDTVVGPNGEQLSVGQRQRLLFARIFLRKPSLALLDEATANLDPELEAKVMDNLNRALDSSAIVFLVAHKPPPNYQYNRPFILNNNRLSEHGPRTS